MTVPVVGQFVPIKFGFYIDNTSSSVKFQKIYAYDTVDYPSIATNIIITVSKQN